MNIMIIILVISTAAIEGISFSYWLQAAINNHDIYHNRFTGKDYTFNRYLGLYNDILTFSACIVTSVLAVVSIFFILKADSRRLFAKISFGTAIILCCLWIACLIYYCLRNEKEELVLSHRVTLHSFRIHYKDRDIVRSVIYIVLSGISIILHITSGVLRSDYEEVDSYQCCPINIKIC